LPDIAGDPLDYLSQKVAFKSLAANALPSGHVARNDIHDAPAQRGPPMNARHFPPPWSVATCGRRETWVIYAVARLAAPSSV